MSAPLLHTESDRAHEVWIVGVAWRAAAAVMAPFMSPRQAVHAAAGKTGAEVLIAAALEDAGVTLEGSAPKLFAVGEAGAETFATAVLAALASLQAEPDTACLVGAMGQEEQTGAWFVMETAARARARGAAAYAVFDASVSVGRWRDGGPHPASPASGRGGELRIGWLELPAGEKDVSFAEQIFAPDSVVVSSALCSAALAAGEATGVRDALALVRAALALGHKVLPFVRPPESGSENTVAAPLPWIHPLPLPGHPATRVPRRAGWVAAATDGRLIGLLLQEDPAAPARPDVVPFSQELCVFGADSPAALHVQVVALHQRLHQPGGAELDLVSLAYQTAAALPRNSAYRLAVVTSSLAELDRQLQELTTQLAAPTPSALQAAHRPSSGIYCGSGLRGSEAGTTAFLFPGLGASYPYMLGDLCLHFPAVREVFDSIDFVAATLGDKAAPLQQVFPRPGEQSQEPLTGAAVITLLMAEWALAQLLRELGIVPDALMGCSTGEFAALCQGGSIDEVAALPIIYRLSLGVAQGLPAAQLATLQSVLVTAAAATLRPLFAAAPGPLYVSADLGPDCALVVGERPAVEWLLAALETRGIAAHVLPSGIPYHTPLLDSATVSGAAELSALTVLAPKLPIWSCATARPYPADPAAVLSAASVLFVRAIALRDTVEAMYQSGVRTFLEVGPGEGLGRRVGAILRGRPHVALASNLQQRTGVAQLLHLLAALHALGYPLALMPLFHRRPHAAALTQAVQSEAAEKSSTSQRPRPRSIPPRPESLLRGGTALPAVTLALPHPERWFCLRIDRWELMHAGGSAGIAPGDLFSKAELQHPDRLLLEPASFLTDWAVKRAVQGLFSRLTRREVALSAITLTTDPAGELRATGDWITGLGGEPVVAAAECEDAAVALVVTADLGVRIGMQISKATALPTSDAQTAVWRALAPTERLLPSALQVSAVDPWTGWVALRAPGHAAPLHARAVRLGAYFVTIAVLARS